MITDFNGINFDVNTSILSNSVVTNIRDCNVREYQSIFIISISKF